MTRYYLGEKPAVTTQLSDLPGVSEYEVWNEPVAVDWRTE